MKRIAICTSSQSLQPCKICLSIKFYLALAAIHTPFMLSHLYLVGLMTTNSHFPYLVVYAPAHFIATPPHGSNAPNCPQFRPPRTLDEALTVSPHPLTPSDPTRTRVLSSVQGGIARHTRSCRCAWALFWKESCSLAQFAATSSPETHLAGYTGH
jgi:hypothetical protein